MSSAPSLVTLYILYGSQTGTAESIAKRIFQQAVQKQYDARLHSLADYDKMKWFSTFTNSISIIVCSTTGNGDAPENADKFWRYIKMRSRPTTLCNGLNYMVLGLGDSNYSNFNNMGKEIDKRLQQLGGVRLLPLCAADDATGLEEYVEPWLEQVWALLHTKYHNTSSNSISKQQGTILASNEQQQQQQQDAPSTINSITSSVHCIVQLQVEKIDTIQTSNSNNNNTTTTNQVYNEEYPFYATLVGARYLTSTAQSAHYHNAKTTIEQVMQYNTYQQQQHQQQQQQSTLQQEEDMEEKQVLHLEFSLEQSGIEFKPGDAIGIKCANQPHMVDFVLSRIAAPVTTTITTTAWAHEYAITRMYTDDAKHASLLPAHITLLLHNSIYHTLMHQVDLHSERVTVPQLLMLAQYCSDLQERQQMLALTKPQSYHVHIHEQHATIMDTLQRFPSCNKIALAHFLQQSSKLQPRFYSITNSPLVHANQVHIAFTCVRYRTSVPYNTIKHGLCSVHYLQNQVAQRFWMSEQLVQVPLWIKSTPEFGLPVSTSATPPLIMIGPGTGVAPFRAFVQHRAFLNNSTTTTSCNNKDLLFHGCRYKNRDCLYREEWDDYQDTCTMIVACSRETQGGLWYGGLYVQDLIQEYAAKIVQIMHKQQGYLYVCGDALGMAKSVHKVLAQVIAEELSVSVAEANKLLEMWRTEKRYQVDVW